jgi:hypothetical protein
MKRERLGLGSVALVLAGLAAAAPLLLGPSALELVGVLLIVTSSGRQPSMIVHAGLAAVKIPSGLTTTRRSCEFCQARSRSADCSATRRSSVVFSELSN